MRLLSRLLIILVVCIAAIALPAAPAQAVNGGPYITLDPNNGVPGMNVTIRGYNFTAGRDLSIYYYRDAANSTRVQVVQVETDDDGYFKDTFIVPESYTGLHEVRAVGTNVSTAQNFTAEPGNSKPQEIQYMG